MLLTSLYESRGRELVAAPRTATQPLPPFDYTHQLKRERELMLRSSPDARNGALPHSRAFVPFPLPW